MIFPSGLKLYFRAEMKLIGHPFIISSLKYCWQINFAYVQETLVFFNKTGLLQGSYQGFKSMVSQGK